MRSRILRSASCDDGATTTSVEGQGGLLLLSSENRLYTEYEASGLIDDSGVTFQNAHWPKTTSFKMRFNEERITVCSIPFLIQKLTF